MAQENANLKYTRLSDAQVMELLNNKAIDAQWDVNNSKSPKGKREAQEELDLYCSAVELLKKMAHSYDVMEIFKKPSL